ncbi:hypothetical protein NDU88_010605 [Pleurodeles waltl]|uniref:Uncharacterized protein n=1 Tax=Pleurodeles waltl TaxID=8319 RepID=A0AAV7R114_PLEWA|nr:hypothetical protein NDU88_010605 [Pleurodeles waltl]
MSQFLQEIRCEIGSIKTDLKSHIKDIKWDVTEIGERVDVLESTVDARLENQEMLQRSLFSPQEFLGLERTVPGQNPDRCESGGRNKKNIWYQGTSPQKAAEYKLATVAAWIDKGNAITGYPLQACFSPLSL